MPYGSERYSGTKNNKIRNPYGGAITNADSARYIPRGGNDYSGAAASAMAIPPVAAAAAAKTDPTTRTPEAITNSGPMNGGIVESENSPGGRKRRSKHTAFASAELLG